MRIQLIQFYKVLANQFVGESLIHNQNIKAESHARLIAFTQYTHSFIQLLTHPSSVRLELCLRASDKDDAPDAPMDLRSRLQTAAHQSSVKKKM